ncbi:MAG: hypothetical protein IH851_03255 [Armatimonadetes bacterium]|nr:hypothetical protein [Armatimonadota bacterium]
MTTHDKPQTSIREARITACAFLRCKNDFYDEPFAEGDSHESSVPRIYWCGKTLGQFGPDEEPAEMETCQPGRDCHCDTIEGNALPLEPLGEPEETSP